MKVKNRNRTKVSYISDDGLPTEKRPVGTIPEYPYRFCSGRLAKSSPFTSGHPTRELWNMKPATLARLLRRDLGKILWWGVADGLVLNRVYFFAIYTLLPLGHVRFFHFF